MFGIFMPDDTKIPYLLYADDDQDDQCLFSEVVAALPVKVKPLIFQDGLYLMQYLQTLLPEDVLPACIVLDVSMPLLDGTKCLSSIRSIRRFDRVPVLMFSTSTSSSDKTRCFELGAKAFLTKPFHRSEYVQLANQLLTWLT